MKRLPPFAALRAFDAASRRLSFREAALELGLTPTAISHQIRRLEAEAGETLFERRARAVALTPAGQRFAAEVAPALRKLESAYDRLSNGAPRAVVALGAGPIFSSRWLAPRLSDFAAAHPDIELRLHHAQGEVWRRAGEFDIAVAWGDGRWPGARARKLLSASLAPVAAPDLIARLGGTASGEDLARTPLLHHRDHGEWRMWLEAAGSGAEADLSGPVFDDANVLLQAALAGQGAMMGYVDLIAPDIASGALVRLSQTSLPAAGAYYLIVADATAEAPATRVADWLLRRAIEK